MARRVSIVTSRKPFSIQKIEEGIDPVTGNDLRTSIPLREEDYFPEKDAESSRGEWGGRPLPLTALIR
ncbi:MAG: hypothetical protein HYT27_01340 [Parcubacteria group bacterium]|nr:hypothetical protein [Parcubacteria group bacterium]